MVRYPESIDDLPPPPRRRGVVASCSGAICRACPCMVMTALLVTVVLWPYIVITVPSGQVGVLWKRFNGFDMYCLCWVGRGTVLDPRELREEGLHIIWPWDKLFLYDLRLQSSTQTYNAISSDGVNVKAQISVRYQLLHNSVARAAQIHRPGLSELGRRSGNRQPGARRSFRNTPRKRFIRRASRFRKQIRDSAQKSSARQSQQAGAAGGDGAAGPKHYNNFLQDSIQLLDTLVLGIELPPEIVSAINRQTEQYYMIQEYKFRVEREAEESKRKQIEADGIAAFQKTVSQGISESYLRWRGIEATLALAQSPNTKIVVIGSGKDGLPIILNSADVPGAPGTEQTTNRVERTALTKAILRRRRPRPSGRCGQPGVPGSSSTPPGALTPNAPPGKNGGNPPGR